MATEPEPAAVLEVQVIPRAARDRVSRSPDGAVRVHVTRPPAEGEANRAVARLLAGFLDLPPSALELVGGARSRHKRFRARGLDAAALRGRIARLEEG